MSRIGKMPVQIPAKVEIQVKGHEVTVKGPKGQLTQTFSPLIEISQDNGQLHVKRPNDERQVRALHGLTRALIANMVKGVSEGYRRTLFIEGVGYRAEMQGKKLKLSLGYSHPIEVDPPANVSFAVEEQRRVHIDGIDKAVVGQIAADIRAMRPPEPYLGKGVRYDGEIIRRKAGKAGKGK